MKRNKESGQALVFAAVAMVALIGFLGLAVDMGTLRYEKRLQQTAADAAAIAGASNLAAQGSSAVPGGAVAAAASDSFSVVSAGSQLCPTSMPACTACPAGTIGTAVGSVAVIVNNPPCSGPHQGAGDASNYVEVFVTVVQPTYFMKVLGVNSETITARAVATDVSGSTTGNGCAWTLGTPTGQIEGINLNGNATINATNCGIVDNGDFNTKGNALTVLAGTFGEAGDTTSKGTVTCFNQPGPCPATGMPASADPFATLPSPCTQYACTGGGAISISGGGSSSCGTGCSYSSSTGLYTISPGTYSSITITGTGTSPGVVFQPGMYVIDGSVSSGSFNETGNATITGDGVTFCFTNGSTINITGTPNISLTAPSTGTYAGVLMYQDPSDTNTGIKGTAGPSLGGNSGASFDGLLYFPKDQITFFGHNNTSVCGAGVNGINTAMLVSDSIVLSGSPTVCLDGPYGAIQGVNILTNAVLVE